MTWFRSKIVPSSPPEPPIEYLYNWDLTESLTDKVNGTTISQINQYELVSGIGLTNPNGNSGAGIKIPYTNWIGKTLEIQFGSNVWNQNSSYIYIVSCDDPSAHSGIKLHKSNNIWYWDIYNNYAFDDSQPLLNSDDFANSTLKVEILSDGKWKVYKDDVFIMKSNNAMNFNDKEIWIGGRSYQGFKLLIIESIKIYETPA